MITQEAIAQGEVKLIQRSAAGDWRVSAHAHGADVGPIRRALGHQVHRSANGIAFLIRGQSLAQLHRLDQICRNGVQFHVAHVLGGRQVHAVHGHVAQTWFGAANLHVLAFALVALQRHVVEPAERIRNVGIRQAGNDLGRQDLEDVVGRALAIERLHFAALALRSNFDHLSASLHLESGVNVYHASRSHGQIVGRERREAHGRNGELVGTRGQATDGELALAVRDRCLPAWLQLHARALHYGVRRVCHVAGNRAFALLRLGQSRPKHGGHQCNHDCRNQRLTHNPNLQK